MLSRVPLVGDSCECGWAGAPCTSDGSSGVCSVSSWAMVRAGDELVRSLLANLASLWMHLLRAALAGRRAGQLPAPLCRDQCPQHPPQPLAAGSPRVTRGLSLTLSSHPWATLAWAGRKASLCPAELPRPTRCPNRASARRLRFVHQYLISASPARRLPRGGSEGPRLYAAHADRQQPGSARQSRPLSACHFKIKGERGVGGSDGKQGLPAPLPLHQ